jgi:hypothetical protein
MGQSLIKLGSYTNPFPSKENNINLRNNTLDLIRKEN